MKLFRISSHAETLHGYKDVHLSWFVQKRERQLFGPKGTLTLRMPTPSRLTMNGRTMTTQRPRWKNYSPSKKRQRSLNGFAFTVTTIRRSSREWSFRLKTTSWDAGRSRLAVDQIFSMIGNAYDLPFTVWGYY